MVLKNATPGRAKKLKNERDLGVAQLSRELIPQTPVLATGVSSQSRATSVIMRPIPSIPVSQQWELQNKQTFTHLIKNTLHDFNQNILSDAESLASAGCCST